MWYVIKGGTMGLNFLAGMYPIEGRGSNFLAYRGSLPTQFLPLVGHPNLPIRKNMRNVVRLLNVMILKRVMESTFFQSNIFTACKIKDGKEVKIL